ncbi:MAG: YbbR-like domain-containing protein [Clostridia bacterium]
MLNNKTFLRIFSLVAAVLLWMYVMGEVDPTKTSVVSNITVSFTNSDVLAEEGLAPIENENMQISAKIKGKRSLVNDVKRNGMSAYVDVSSCKEGKNTVEVKINTPDGISVESTSDEYLTFEVEAIEEAEKPVSISFEGKSGSKSKVPWVLSFMPETVTVSGASSLIDKVSEVRGTVSVADMSEDHSSWEYATVTAVDEKGNAVAGVSVQDGSVTAEVRILTVKTVTLEVSAENMEDGYEADSISADSQIKIVAPAEVLDHVDSIKGTADMTGVSDTETHKIKLNFDLPEGVYLYNSNEPVTAKIRLKAISD